MSSPQCIAHSEISKSACLLSNTSICVIQGGVSLRIQESARYNELRFAFLVDAASCTPSPQMLFSMTVRRNERLCVTVQSCQYPAAHGLVRLSLQLCDRLFSTSIPCGSWVSTSLCICGAHADCPKCSSARSRAPSSANANFSLCVTAGDSSFLMTSDFPQSHFREALNVGCSTNEKATQPAVFRDIVASFAPNMCAQCMLLAPSAFPPCVVEPGFLAPLSLRCNAVDIEGVS
jgi:hypothetical protein